MKLKDQYFRLQIRGPMLGPGWGLTIKVKGLLAQRTHFLALLCCWLSLAYMPHSSGCEQLLTSSWAQLPDFVTGAFMPIRKASVSLTLGPVRAFII